MEVRPDSLWSWLVCAASVLSIVIVSGGAYNFGLLLAPLMDHFNTTRQATGKVQIVYCAYDLTISMQQTWERPLVVTFSGFNYSYTQNLMHVEKTCYK